MKAFIFAAGFGSRMQELTQSCPKPLLKINGYELLTYTLFQLYRWQIKDVIINTHYLSEQINSYLSRINYFNFTISHEKDILETAGAIRNVFEPNQTESLVILNPDVIFFAADQDQPKPLEASCLSHLYLSLKNENQKSEPGWQLNHNNKIIFEDQSQYYYIGYSILSTQIVKHLERGTVSKLGPIWKNQSLKGKISGQIYKGQLFDVGHKKSYNALKDKNLIPTSLQTEWQDFLRLVFS